MALWDFLFGKKEKMMQVPTMSGGQQDFLSQLLSGIGAPMQMGMQNLSQLLSGSPEAIQAFQAPAMRQFNEQIVPGIAERFSGMGSGSLGSSAFGQQMGAAGAGLSENLAQMRSILQQNALSQLMGFGQMGLGTKPFENVYRPATQGFIGGMAPGIGTALGMGMTGGMGGMGGLSSLLNLFKSPRVGV